MNHVVAAGDPAVVKFQKLQVADDSAGSQVVVCSDLVSEIDHLAVRLLSAGSNRDGLCHTDCVCDLNRAAVETVLLQKINCDAARGVASAAVNL